MSLHDEIHEQPAVLERFLARQKENVGEIVEAVRDRRSQGVLVAARGSSDNAGTYAKYVLGARNSQLVTLATPSLYSRYQRAPEFGGVAVIAISQSGQSPDVIAVCQAGREQGAPTVAITNDSRSPLARACEFVIDLEAGDERAIAATKSYLAELLAIATWSAAWGQEAEDWERLAELPALTRAVLAREDEIANVARGASELDSCVVLGRGYNLASAQEWALKLREMARVPATPYSSADFRHGPRAALAPEGWVLALRADGPVAHDIDELLRELTTDQAAKTLSISASSEERQGPPHEIELGPAVEWLSPFPLTVAAQLLTYHLAAARGVDPDRPPSLSKVTRTR